MMIALLLLTYHRRQHKRWQCRRDRLLEFSAVPLRSTHLYHSMLYTYIYIYTHIYLSIYLSLYIHTHTHIRQAFWIPHINVGSAAEIAYSSSPQYLFEYAYYIIVYIYICNISLSLYIYIYYVYIYICIYIYIYIYTYVYMYIHTMFTCITLARLRGQGGGRSGLRQPPGNITLYYTYY